MNRIKMKEFREPIEVGGYEIEDSPIVSMRSTDDLKETVNKIKENMIDNMTVIRETKYVRLSLDGLNVQAITLYKQDGKSNWNCALAMLCAYLQSFYRSEHQTVENIYDSLKDVEGDN